MSDTIAPATAAAAALTQPAAPRVAAGAKAARDFEAYFVTSMLESMWAGVKTDPMFGGGPGEAMYRSLLNQEYGKAVAAHGSLHIADSVLREMVTLQAGGHG